MEQSYARSAGGSDEGPKLPPEVAHEIEGYRRTVWEVPNNFILAMAQYPTDAMHLIYSPTGKNQDLDDEHFSFFDGLLVGLPNGKVTVLAVEKESKAEKAGIKAGDEIVSVGGASTQNDLAAFAAAYSTAKKTAKENEVDSYPMTLRSEGKAETRTVNIPLPPKLKSGLMDGF
jgi:predicted metalloprotease with PDZ domain